MTHRNENKSSLNPHGKEAAIRFLFHHSEIHTLFEELIHKPWGYQIWKPLIAIIEKEDAFVIKADLPDVRPEDVIVRATGSRLLLEGRRTLDEGLEDETLLIDERPQGLFFREIEFFTELAPDSVSKQYDRGVLTINVKKRNEDDRRPHE
jgi:HSP20 family protein